MKLSVEFPKFGRFNYSPILFVMPYTIRKMQSNDAKAFIELLQQTDAETNFMIQEPGERKTNPFQVSMAIASGVHNIFLAEYEGEIVGHLAAFYLYGRGNRIKHVVHIGISVLKAHWGKGLGTRLFEAAEKWALNNEIVRLELSVMKHNERGLRLYQKMGFETEGTKKASVCVDGEYIDEYLMSKILTQNMNSDN